MQTLERGRETSRRESAPSAMRALCLELATCRRRRKEEGGEEKEKKRRRKDKTKQEKEKGTRKKKCYFFHFKIVWSLFSFLRVV